MERAQLIGAFLEGEKQKCETFGYSYVSMPLLVLP